MTALSLLHFRVPVLVMSDNKTPLMNARFSSLQQSTYEACHRKSPLFAVEQVGRKQCQNNEAPTNEK